MQNETFQTISSYVLTWRYVLPGYLKQCMNGYWNLINYPNCFDHLKEKVILKLPKISLAASLIANMPPFKNVSQIQLNVR